MYVVVIGGGNVGYYLTKSPCRRARGGDDREGSRPRPHDRRRARRIVIPNDGCEGRYQARRDGPADGSPPDRGRRDNLSPARWRR
jgi:hypothetical protein